MNLQVHLITEVMKAINTMRGKKTIAHRLTTIEKCDKVIELENGTIKLRK